MKMTKVLYDYEFGKYSNTKHIASVLNHMKTEWGRLCPSYEPLNLAFKTSRY